MIGGRGGDALAMFCECHLQPYHEQPSDGPPIAAGRERQAQGDCREGSERTRVDLEIYLERGVLQTDHGGEFSWRPQAHSAPYTFPTQRPKHLDIAYFPMPIPLSGILCLVKLDTFSQPLQ